MLSTLLFFLGYNIFTFYYHILGNITHKVHLCKSVIQLLPEKTRIVSYKVLLNPIRNDPGSLPDRLL